jgi:hypothetical protein
MKEKIQKIIMLLIAYVPRRLPDTANAFETWTNEIIELGDFPANDSFKHAVATQVLHLPPGELKKSQMYFVNTLRRSITNQAAFSVIQATKANSGNLNEKAV